MCPDCNRPYDDHEDLERVLKWHHHRVPNVMGCRMINTTTWDKMANFDRSELNEIHRNKRKAARG